MINRTLPSGVEVQFTNKSYQFAPDTHFQIDTIEFISEFRMVECFSTYKLSYQISFENSNVHGAGGKLNPQVYFPTTS